MDLSDPTRAVTGQLDGTVLAVLANAGSPLTVGQVAERAPRGSEIGIRRSLSRLIQQGLVRAMLMGRNQVHELNRDHVAAGVAIQLAELRTELWRRFRQELVGWSVRPLFAAVFGSAARGDGDESSDIDLLLVHPPSGGGERVSGFVGFSVLASQDSAHEWARPEGGWQGQIDALRRSCEAWTGNPLQVIDLSVVQWIRPDEDLRRLLANVAHDGIELMRSPQAEMWATWDTALG